MEASLARRWVLVAGTGWRLGTPRAEVRAARAIGAELARHGYGLVSGAWRGVDYAVVEAFLAELRQAASDPADHLIQVLPVNGEPLHGAGRIVRTPQGAMEWLEPQKYADAVILIGGRGGTYRTWLGALHANAPRFPLGGTSGDARSAFRDTLELWELIPVPGLTRAQFERLGASVRTADAADALARHLVGELLWRSLDAVDVSLRPRAAERPSLFISYSRKDLDWVTRLRTLLSPAERRGQVSTWMDADIEPGRRWEEQLLGRIERARAALLLMSPALLESEYVREVEIPAFVRRVETRDADFRLFWTLLEPCAWDSVPELRQFQAIGDPRRAISQSATAADAQVRLIELAERVVQEMRPAGDERAGE